MPGSAVTVLSTHGEASTVRAIRHVVGEGYFETTGIAIRLGRAFRKEDEAEDSAKVIVSQALAQELWSGQDPIGRSLEIRNGAIGPPKILPGSFDFRPTVAGDGARSFEVIGVAVDVAEGLVAGKPRPAIYFPLHASSYGRPPLQGITLLARGVQGVDVLSGIQQEALRIDSKVVPFNSRSMDDQIKQFMSPLRMAAWTYALTGVFGVVLACVGIAGVTGYSVAQRTREIGIRMALGATSRDVLLAMMREGLTLIVAGSALGAGGAWAASRFLSAMNATVGVVTSTSSSDSTVLLGAPLLLTAIAIAACYLPARRSTRIDPIVALREE
jgi:putative ABC transport system permease protein